MEPIAQVAEIEEGLNEMEMYGSSTGYAYLFIDGELTAVFHISEAKEIMHEGQPAMYQWTHEGISYYLPVSEFDKDR
jgi:hypothetical protein